jgi:2'-5' RNA ligase
VDNVDCYTGRVTPERRYSIQTGAMRLFVAAWPAESALGALADVRPITETPDLRWVPPVNWHVTLAFLGSVPDDEHDELVEALRSIGRLAPPCAAILGPETTVLGTRVLCVPVGGLGELALMVRECTAPFNRSKDREESFVGHLTLARANRGRSVPLVATGVPVSSVWPVTEIRLVSSTTRPDGAEYSQTALVALDGRDSGSTYEHVFGDTVTGSPRFRLPDTPLP